MKPELLTIRILFIIFISTTLVNAQRNIELMYVQNVGFETNHVISQEQIHKNIENLEITCTLNDPIELDSFFNLEDSNNGKFNYLYYSESSETFFKKRRWFGNKQKKENNNYETLTDGLSALLAEKKITPLEYEILLKQINNTYLEKEYSSQLTNYKNPFFINNKYLSVIKIQIVNNSNNKITINKKDFLLNSGNVNFKLFSADDLIDMHQLNNSLNNSIYEKIIKFNFPQNFIIHPKESIIYYLASLPILNESNSVSLYFKNTSFDWTNDITTNEINSIKKYYAINVNPKIGNDNILEVNSYYIVRDIIDKSYINDSKNKIYTNLKSKFSILAYCVYKNKLYLTTTDTINPKDYIDLEKKKRKKLYIKYSEYINE